MLLENLADPSHLPFSHPGRAGLNREKALAMPFTPIPVPEPGTGDGDGGAATASTPSSGAEAGAPEGGRPPCVFPHAQPVGLFRYPTVSGEGSLALVAVNAPCSVSYYSRLSTITLSAEVSRPLVYLACYHAKGWSKEHSCYNLDSTLIRRVADLG